MIETSLADFNEKFNVMFSIGDIRNVSFGSNNKSYTINVPLTKRNKNLLNFITQSNVKSEPTLPIRLYIDGQLIVYGTPVILSYDDYYAKIIINIDDWMDDLKLKKMTELDLSLSDHVLSKTNIEASWTASYPMYRYPMINFGALVSAEYGTTAKWSANDFIPMISVSGLITKILSPYVIVSTWLATNFVKDLYIIGKETVADNSFIQNKALELAVGSASDNDTTESIPTSTTTNVILGKTIEFSTETKDEANGFSINTYTIPVTGTYRFVASIVLRNTAYGNANITILNETAVVEMKKGSTVLQSVDAGTYVATELIENKTFALDSGYYHFVAGDLVTITVAASCYAQNIGVGTESVSVGTKVTSTLLLVWNNANRYTGINKNISLEEMLPDMTQLDFLAAIRDIFNLRFWMDKNNNKIYIEPWDTFISSTVVDLTNYIDHESFPAELISPSYNKKIKFKWKDDSGDKAYEEYLKLNAEGPGGVEITLSSLYAKKEPETREHQFSSVCESYNWIIMNWSVLMPAIWNSTPESPYTTYDRKVGFNTRIVEWKGLTSGLTWYFDADTKTTYPKIAGLDWLDLYNDYWIKFFHWVDRGKLYTVRMKNKLGMLSQFITVVNTKAAEGFSPTYKIPINGIDNYFVLQKITTDGDMSELEVFLK
jgi:hypothetical protein